MKTYWNGLPCKAERMQVIVGKPHKPTWWCAPLEGKEHSAIKISVSGESFYINDDEEAWLKITQGKGMWDYAHKSLPVEREIDSKGESGK